MMIAVTILKMLLLCTVVVGNLLVLWIARRRGLKISYPKHSPLMVFAILCCVVVIVVKLGELTGFAEDTYDISFFGVAVVNLILFIKVYHGLKSS